jgi:hypothetical protein
VEFANRKNLHCVPMSALGGTKLANPLTTNVFYGPLGSATAKK